jgi:trimeric autotransporter adhesin
LAEEELPEEYLLSDASADLGELTVAAQATAAANAASVVAGASNADDLTLAVTYTLADTLANLTAAGADVLAGGTYSLTDAAGSLGALTAAQQAIFTAATNAADYTFDGTVITEAQLNTLAGVPTYSAGSTINLEFGVDEYTGTSNNLFFGELGTLRNTTEITGGAGVNTLYAENSSSLLVGPTTVNVQHVVIDNQAGTERSVNTENMDGLISLSTRNSEGDVVFQNVESSDINLGVISTDASLTVEYTRDALGAAAETDTAVDVLLVDAQGGDLTIGTTSVLAVGGIETLNIGSYSLDATVEANEIGTFTDTTFTASIETINIEGSQDLVIGGLVNTAVETINATGLEASLDIDVGTLLTDDLTVIGSTGGENIVRATVDGEVASTLTNIQSLNLEFEDAGVFDATNTNIAAAYTLSGTSVGLANVVRDSTFTTSALTAGAAASEIGFGALSDFNLTVTAAATPAAVAFGGIDFTEVRNVIVTNTNTAATTLGAVDLGDLGRGITVNNNDEGTFAVGNISVGAENSLSQTLALTTTTTDGTIDAGSYTAEGDIVASMTAVSAAITADELVSTAGAVSLTVNATSANVTIANGGADTNIVDAAETATLDLTAAANRDITLDAVEANLGAATLTATLAQGTATTAGGEVTMDDLESLDGGVTLTVTSGGGVVNGNRAEFTADDILATEGDVVINVTSAAGSTVTIDDITADVSGDVTITAVNNTSGTVLSELDLGAILADAGNVILDVTNGDEGTVDVVSVTSTEGNVTLDLTSGDEGTFAFTGNVLASEGDVSIEATAAGGAGSAFTLLTTTATVGNVVVAATGGARDFNIGDVTASGDLTFEFTNTADTAGQAIDFGHLSVTDDGTLTAIITNTSAAAAVAALNMNEIISDEGDIVVTLVNGTAGTIDLNAQTATDDSIVATLGDVTVDITTGTGGAITVNGVTEATDGDLVVSIGTSAAAAANSSTVTLSGALIGDTVIFEVEESEGTGDITLTGGITSAGGATTGTTITASLSGEGDVDLGTLVVATGAAALVDAERLEGDLAVIGSGGDDTVIGGDGDDVIEGAAGADVLFGGAGDDTLEGGTGADTLTGGAGADTFLFEQGDGTEAAFDTISDFAIATDELEFVTAGTTHVADTANVEVGAAAGAAVDDVHADLVDGIMTLSLGTNSTATAADVAAFDTFAEWMEALELAVEGSVGSAATAAGVVAGFVFDGDTYISEWAIAAGNAGTLQNLVQLTGITGITDIDTTAAANTVVIA